jgi:formin 2
MLAGIAGRGGGGGRGGMLAGIAGRGGGGLPSPAKKASVTEEDLGLKPKPKIEPAKKLKSLFWSKVQPKSLAGTVWMTMQENQKIDFKDLESDFFDAAKAKREATATGGDDGDGKKSVKKEKPKEIILVDPKRNQNVSIALARFKNTNEELKKKIIAFDPVLINGETIGKIQMMIPEEEEIGTINDFEGDKAMLGKVEKFYLEMVKIPRLKMR